MKFVVKDKDGRNLFYTEHESCVPVDKIDSMNSSGLQFYLDGKKISASNVKNQFKDITPPEVLEYEHPVIEPVVSTPVELQQNFQKVDIKTGVTTDSSELKDSVAKIDLNTAGFQITSRTVVCMNNGRIFKNQKEAAEALNIDINWVSYSITGKKPYNGWEFKRAVDLQ